MKVEIQEQEVGMERISQQVLHNDTEGVNRWIANNELLTSLLECLIYPPENSTSIFAT